MMSYKDFVDPESLLRDALVKNSLTSKLNLRVGELSEIGSGFCLRSGG